MKKIIYLALVLILAAGMLAGCGGNSGDSTSDEEGKLKIVTTIFPIYDWTNNILGDLAENADVTMLLNSGVDLHSYQPTAEDIKKIATCDMFIYVGGESDEWVSDALDEAVNKDMVVINLLEVLGDYAKTEETVEGMEEDADHDDGDADHEEDADHEDGEEEGSDHEDGEELDEHVWLSLKNAEILTGAIREKLSEIDEKNSDAYKANTEAYAAKLASLDKEYRDAVSSAKRKTVLFGDRFPFRYMADDYDLEYYAAFAGCSAETEASFETVTFLAGKVDELKLPCVLTIEGTKHNIAETIVKNTKNKDQEILTMDSMQATTSADAEGGAAYIDIMKKNLEVLTKALN